eukprot:4215298-Karenia_brevis.AAC.1
MEGAPNLPVGIGEVDIEVAFYAIGLPSWLSDYFGMEPVKAGDVGVTEIDGARIGPKEMVYPCVSVAPMGCTLALWLCQTLMEDVSARAPGVHNSN